MRILATLAFCLFFLSFQPSPAQSRQVYSGMDLLKNCFDTVVCDAFFAGLLDSYVTITGWANVPAQFCIKGPSEGHELWPFVGTILLAKPDELNFSADSLSLRALVTKYPCESGSPAVAQPAFLSGHNLIEICQNVELCEAFLVGVLGAHTTLIDWGTLPNPYLCIPEPVENEELILTLLTYLGENQDQLSYSGGGLTIIALSKTYGCGV